MSFAFIVALPFPGRYTKVSAAERVLGISPRYLILVDRGDVDSYSFLKLLKQPASSMLCAIVQWRSVNRNSEILKAAASLKVCVSI